MVGMGLSGWLGWGWVTVRGEQQGRSGCMPALTSRWDRGNTNACLSEHLLRSSPPGGGNERVGPWGDKQVGEVGAPCPEAGPL